LPHYQPRAPSSSGAAARGPQAAAADRPRSWASAARAQHIATARRPSARPDAHSVAHSTGRAAWAQGHGAGWSSQARGVLQPMVLLASLASFRTLGTPPIERQGPERRSTTRRDDDDKHPSTAWTAQCTTSPSPGTTGPGGCGVPAPVPQQSPLRSCWSRLLPSLRLQDATSRSNPAPPTLIRARYLPECGAP
jgi:hypothetical protein